MPPDSRQSEIVRPLGKTRKEGHAACTRCHSLKIKCSRDLPCRNCQNSQNGAHCIYPVRDRKVAVSEKYLKRIIAENHALKQGVPAHETSTAVPDELQPAAAADFSPPAFQRMDDSMDSNVQNPLCDEVARFVDDGDVTRPMYIGEAASTTFETRIRQLIKGQQSVACSSRSSYFKDQRLLRIRHDAFQLPRQTYAILLVQTMLHFIGADFHMIMKQSFLRKLEETYKSKDDQDPVWLTRLFLVFALGELYLKKPPSPTDGSSVPGTKFFLQAMSLFPDLYEEADLGYIETLVLMSYYSNALNRTRSAHALAGLAVRLSLTLGLHRDDSHDRRLSPLEREHRHRVWWTLYSFDRLGCSKLGQPVFIRDEDIDTPLPTMNGLTEQEKEEFMDPDALIATVKLAEITGSVLDLIYCAPKARKSHNFVRNVHQILTRLRSWDEQLPSQLKLDPKKSPPYPSRPVASQRLHFNECINNTTRPVLFHIFQNYVSPRNAQGSSQAPMSPSLMTSALSDACIHSARNSINLFVQLWIHGSIAVFGYFDAHYIFTATIVLLISNVLQPNQEDDDSIDTAINLLQSMKDQGNLPAHEYIERLLRLKGNLEEVKSMRSNSDIRTSMSGQDQDGPNIANIKPVASLEAIPFSQSEISQTTSSPSGTSAARSMAPIVSAGPPEVPHPMPIPPTSTIAPPTNEATFELSYSATDWRNPAIAANEPLNDPLLQGFLMQPNSQWSAEALTSIEEFQGYWIPDTINSFEHSFNYQW